MNRTPAQANDTYKYYITSTRDVFNSTRDAIEFINSAEASGYEFEDQSITGFNYSQLVRDLEDFNEKLCFQKYDIDAVINEMLFEKEGRIELKDFFNIPHVFDIDNF